MDLWKRLTQPPPPLPAKAIVIGPAEPVVVRPARPILVKPAVPVRVEPPPRGLWDERGWTCEQRDGARHYQGFFQVRQRRTRQNQAYPGRITQDGRYTTLYIADPPTSLNRHPKWACFHREQGRWFRLNWYRAAHNVDDAILYMERILDEAVN